MLMLAAGPAYAAPEASTTSVTSSNNPAKFGESISFTATVTPATATGTVQFKIDGANVATGTLSGGKAAVAMSHNPAAGTHTVTAEYRGDANVAPSTGTLSGGQRVTKAETATTVTSSRNPARAGESVAFTATVTPPTASGSVRFKIDGSNIGAATVSDGKATVAMSSSPAAGTHTVTADYSGDGNFDPSSGTLPGGQTISAPKAGSTTAVVVNPNPVTWADSVMFTATVTPSSATGTVQFKIDGTDFGSPAPLSGGKAAVGMSHSPLAGTRTVTAHYSGDANLNSSSGTVPGGLKVIKRDSEVVLSSNRNPSQPGDRITFTAQVFHRMGTGTVQFKIDGSKAGAPVAVREGVARYETGDLSTGNHTVVAEYSGDSNLHPSSGTLAGGQRVTAGVPPKADTTTGVSFSHSISNLGESSAIIATVTPSSATGTVQFKIDGANFGSPEPLSGGVARSREITGIAAGPHTVTAEYSGDARFKPSSGSSPYTHRGAKAATTTSLKLDPSTPPGKAVTLVATVSPSTATGTVQFKLNGKDVGAPVPLSGGVARSIPVDLSAGSPTVGAFYSGDANFLGSGAAVHVDRFEPEGDRKPKPPRKPDILPRTGSDGPMLSLLAAALIGSGFLLLRRGGRTRAGRDAGGGPAGG